MPIKTERLLKLVSRSFSIAIAMLPKKVKKNIGNFYLLCRYADSIEDSNLPTEKKAETFKKFIFSVKKEDVMGVREVSKEILPFVIYENDKKMIKHFGRVMKEFVSFPKKDKEISKKWLTSMARGMQKYSKKDIENFRDLNNYCYFVAGTVGMYLTELFEYKFNIARKVELSKRAKDFGLLLQKVNIIRDFSKDYKEGRVFWPKKLFAKHNVTVDNVFNEEHSVARQKILAEMIKSTKKNIANSIEYIEMLPKGETMLRASCAIPFCMALPTLMKCEENEKIFDTKEKVKIDRDEVAKILLMIKNNLGETSFIRDYSKETLKVRAV